MFKTRTKWCNHRPHFFHLSLFFLVLRKFHIVTLILWSFRYDPRSNDGNGENQKRLEKKESLPSPIIFQFISSFPFHFLSWSSTYLPSTSCSRTGFWGFGKQQVNYFLHRVDEGWNVILLLSLRSSRHFFENFFPRQMTESNETGCVSEWGEEWMDGWKE